MLQQKDSNFTYAIVMVKIGYIVVIIIFYDFHVGNLQIGICVEKKNCEVQSDTQMTAVTSKLTNTVCQNPQLSIMLYSNIKK